jgi:hypothetical protein
VPFDFYFGVVMSDNGSYFFIEDGSVNHDDVATSKATNFDIGA